jgi:pimeloyl-ACP methyl ester carboxylesterase
MANSVCKILLLSIFFQQVAFCSINVSEAVQIGGIHQWIQIKSEKDQSPLLLFLHGGPGNSAMGYAHKFTSELQKNFIVVLWDQRETGKTLQINGTNQPLSLSLMESDVKEMMEYLGKRFSKDKIYLMGHSWGGFLALRMAALHPEKLAACLAISPMIDQRKSERLSLDWMIVQAKRSKNLRATAELSQVKIPFQNASQIYFHRNWLAHFTGGKPISRTYVEGWATKWLKVFEEASAIDLKTASPTLRCPVFFFIGQKDYQTHYTLAQEYFTLLKAEKKELIWFPNSGHNLNLTEPKRVQEIVISLSGL